MGASKEKRRRKIARLFCLARDLGMSNDMLHVAVYGITGCESIRMLNMQQLNSCIAYLFSEQKKRQRKKYDYNARLKKTGVLVLPSIEQRNLIRKLVSSISCNRDLYDPDGWLNAICLKTFKKPFSKLNRQEAKNLIEVLKSINARGATCK
jgi:hypothetical protein